MKAVHLQTEYLTEPLGLGISSPRFYWICEGGKRQTAYHIIAKRDGDIVWDSGEVESGSMTHIPYSGKPLESRERIVWSVRLKDEKEEWGEPCESWFEMGLLNPDDWRAQWITGDYEPKKNMRYPVDCFKKEFRLEKLKALRNLIKARLYITACGLYEAKLNGQRIGNYRLAPGCTDYRKRLQYQVYDVTGLLEEENALTVQLADGWYRGSVGCYGMTNVFGRRTKLLCQLEITYADGGCEVITSDESWAWSNDGPRRFADLKDGEIYDACMAPSFSGSAKRADAPGTVPAAADNVAPVEHWPSGYLLR